MHSETIEHQHQAHNKKDTTHCCWNQRVLFQELFHSHTANPVVVLIYGLTCSLDANSPLHIIDTHEGYMLRHISRHSHVRDTIHWYETPGTRAVTKIAEANYDYSEMYMSF